MRVVYCIAGLWPSGGTERVVTTKMNWLATKGGCEVHVVMHDGHREEFFPLSAAVRRHYVAEGAPLRVYRRELTALLMGLRADVVICTGGAELPFLWKIKDGSKKILEFHYTRNFLVNFVRGIRHIRFKQLHLLKVWLMQKRIAHHARRYDRMVGLTERDVHLWGDPANMTYIYNPLSFRSERKSTTANKEIIAVGSFTPAKGMDQLVEAFGRIAHRHADWHLSLYGQGQDYGLLQELIEKYGIRKQVSVNEPYQRIGEKLVEAGIYAFPSRSDGFGLVITEAMECGLPCVAMDCECGPREIVSPRTGLLVPPQDIAAFAAALERLMDDAPLRRSMGDAAQMEVARFYPDNIMPQWLRLFETLIKEN